MHWAYPLMSVPYRDRGMSPEEGFSCWGLVRWVFRHRLGLDLPEVQIGLGDADSEDNLARIKAVYTQTGWRPAPRNTPVLEWDIVIVQSLLGRHVGVMVYGNRSLGCLHCVENGGVRFQSLSDMEYEGYTDFEFWRKA